MMKLQLTDKQNIFFCSDPHYNHKSIVKGTTEWKASSMCRNFSTLEEHNERLISNINETVGLNDILFCNGDWNFGSYSNKENTNGVKEFRDRLNVKELHFIYGNHDTEIRKSKELQSCFSSVQDYLELQIAIPYKEQGIKARKQLIVLSHYSMRSWNRMHKNSGSYMLYGHSHGNLPGQGKSMDVGFDCHKEFRPFSFKEIDELLVNKDVVSFDHHN